MSVYKTCLVIVSVLAIGCGRPGEEATTSNTDTGLTTGKVKAADSLKPKEEKPGADSLIIPGEKVGKVSLGTPAEKLSDILGKPDFSDAAMGKAWLTWYGKQDGEAQTELNIYTAYKDTTLMGKTVQIIRSTSAFFTTPDHISVGTKLDVIGTAYPKLKYLSHYKNEKTKAIISLYEAVGKGIAFEIAVVDEKKTCTAIIIYNSSETLLPKYQTYLNANGWTATNRG